MRVLVLTAGFGKRLLPHTQIVAKPAIPFLGVPGMCYSVALTMPLKPTRMVFNLHHLPETIKTAAHHYLQNEDFEICFSQESPNILDSGGGIKQAETLLKGDGNFVTLNGDTVLLVENENLLMDAFKQHQTNNALATLVVKKYPHAGDTHGGVFLKPGTQNVSHFAKKRTDELEAPMHYLGIAIYSDRVFGYLPKGRASNILYDGLTQAINQGESVEVFEAPKVLWFETGNEDDFLAAERDCIDEISQQTKYGAYLSKVLQRYNKALTDDIRVDTVLDQSNPFPLSQNEND